MSAGAPVLNRALYVSVRGKSEIFSPEIDLLFKIFIYLVYKTS